MGHDFSRDYDMRNDAAVGCRIHNSHGQALSQRILQGASYIVCSFDPTKDNLRLFWLRDGSKPYRTFAALAADLEAKGKSLQFAINGGMYQTDFRPVGLYIENGRELAPANTASRSGSPTQIPNFYKKPNGVFYVGDEEAGVLETGRFVANKTKADFATQSGPMLVIDGSIHSAFIVNSADRKGRRRSVKPNQGHFVISNDWVSFYEFARFFFAMASAAAMPSFSTGALRPGFMRQSSGAMTRQQMAATGPSSRWWTKLRAKAAPRRRCRFE